MKRIKKYIVGGAGASLLLNTGTVAFAGSQTYLDTSLPASSGPAVQLVLAAAVVVLVLAAMTWFVRQGRSGRINVAWAVLAAVLSGLAMLLGIVGSTSGTMYTKAEGDPAETVRVFYDSLIRRDYVAAYSCLSDYAGLGLEDVPESHNAALVYEALRNSYDYTLMGEAQIDGLEAAVNVRFRYLDMPSMEQSIASRTDSNLQDIVRNSPVSQVYDENDKYLPQVTEKAYSDALAFVLEQADSYYSTAQLEIKLEYRDGKWLMKTDEEMLGALMGASIYR